MIYRELRGPITVAMADAEPLDQRLFGPSYDARMQRRAPHNQSSGINRASYTPWKKPRIERAKR
jgi:hypothetical protein